MPPDPLGVRLLGVSTPVVVHPPLPNPGCANGDDRFYFSFQSSAALGFKIFSNAALYANSLPTPVLTHICEVLTPLNPVFFYNMLKYICIKKTAGKISIILDWEKSTRVAIL